MPPRVSDPAFRLAVTALARIQGVTAASRMAVVDIRTVQGWLDAAGDEDHDEGAWDAAMKLAQSRHLQGLITGKASGVGQWAMAAGISARNRRMVAVQARHDARKAAALEEAKPPPEPAWIDAWRQLDETHAALARLSWDTAHDERRPKPADERPALTDAQINKRMVAWLAGIAALTDDEVAAQLAELQAARDAFEAALAAAEAERQAQQRPEPPPAVSAAPGPSYAAPAPSSPHGLRVVPREADHRTWKELR